MMNVAVSQQQQQQQQQQQKQQQQRRKVRNSLIAGSCSGVVSTGALYPLEFVRVQLQQDANRTMMQILQASINRPSILYTGLALPLAAQTVYKATVFSVTTSTEQWILQYRGQQQHDHSRNDDSKQDKDTGVTLTRMDRFYSGCVGGAVNAALFVTPVEFVRNQLIAQQQQQQQNDHRLSNTTTIRQVIQHHFQNGGIRTLWRGVGWTVARDAIGCGAFFYTVHRLQEAWSDDDDNNVAGSMALSPTVRTLLSGAVAGVMFWIVALPMDTVKTWIQSSTDQNKHSARMELITIYQNHGSRGVIQRLLRGWEVAYTRAMPSAALTMITYNSVYQLLDNIDDTTFTAATNV